VTTVPGRVLCRSGVAAAQQGDALS
jgi:hypothetical protein